MVAHVVFTMGVVFAYTAYYLWVNTNLNFKSTAAPILLGASVALLSWVGLAYFVPPAVERVTEHRIMKQYQPNGTIVEVIEVDGKQVNVTALFGASVPPNAKIRRIKYQDLRFGLKFNNNSKYEIVQ